MKSVKSKYWWIFFIRGVLAMVFGLTAMLLWPLVELGLMGSFFGSFIFIQGALTLFAYLKIRRVNRSLPVLLESVLGMSVGIFLVVQTTYLTPTVFVVSFVLWGIGAGLCKVIGSLLLYRKQQFHWVLVLVGLLSILFNSMFYIQADLEKGYISYTLAYVLGIYFVIYGMLLTIFSFRLKASQA